MQGCTLLQTDHTNTPPLCFLQAGCPSCRLTHFNNTLTHACISLSLFTAFYSSTNSMSNGMPEFLRGCLLPRIGKTDAQQPQTSFNVYEPCVAACKHAWKLLKQNFHRTYAINKLSHSIWQNTNYPATNAQRFNEFSLLQQQTAT